MRGLLLAVGLAGGCERDLLADIPDASVDAPVMGDAPASTSCKAPPTDAQPAAMYTLYINTEGVTLMPCGTADARINCSGLVAQDTAFPPFLDGNPNRDSFIATILYSVRKGLAPYSIEVTTMRPTTGAYNMIVLGGTPQQLGLNPAFLDVAPFQCTPDNRNNVSIAFDHGQMPTTYDYANTILSDTGLFAGLAGTTATNDCLCRGAGNCTIDPNQLCTYGVVSTDPNPAYNCARTMQDEPALLQAAYGCR